MPVLCRLLRWASYAKKSVANGATAEFVAAPRLIPAAVARRTASVSRIMPVLLRLSVGY